MTRAIRSGVPGSRTSGAQPHAQQAWRALPVGTVAYSLVVTVWSVALAGVLLPAYGFALPGDEVTTWVDVRRYAERKHAAMAAHASQSDNIMFLQMPPEVFSAVMGVETFLRVRDTTGAPLPEDDLFAGLR